MVFDDGVEELDDVVFDVHSLVGGDGDEVEHYDSFFHVEVPHHHYHHLAHHWVHDLELYDCCGVYCHWHDVLDVHCSYGHWDDALDDCCFVEEEPEQFGDCLGVLFFFMELLVRLLLV